MVQFFVVMALVLSSSVFASSDTPECKEWKNRLEVEQQDLRLAEEDLTKCEATFGKSSPSCHEEAVLVETLKAEKKMLKDFIKNFC